MKSIKYYFAAALALVFAASCAQEEIPSNEVVNPHLIPVTFVAEGNDTKTTLGDNNAIVWESGDQISVLDDSEWCTAYEPFATESEGASADFSGLIGDDASVYYALYPFDQEAQDTWMYEDGLGMFSTSLKSSQLARVGGLPAMTHITVAKADENKAFAFKNLCGVLKFTLTQDHVISSIEIRPNGGESITGPINVEVNEDGTFSFESTASETSTLSIDPAEGDTFAAGTYYVSALPGTYAEGVEILFLDANAEEATISSSAALTVTAGKIRNLGSIDKNVFSYQDPHADDEGWYLVKDVRALAAGDVIRIGCASKNAVAGPRSGDFLESCSATFVGDEMTAVAGTVENMVLGRTGDSWTITLSNGNILGATSAKKMTDNSGASNFVGEWTISISDEGVATLTSTGNKYGTILYNVSSPRFLNYASAPSASMLLPQIYKKYGTPSDGNVKQEPTISFKPTSYTATIGATNSFPVLSCSSDGARSWESSNTSVATVDANGTITLVSAGTTTIKVTVAETETFNPCTAEYVLTVDPAPVVVDGQWTLVTSANNLSVGDVIVITSKDADKVMGKINANNISAADVKSVSSDKATITVGEDALQLTLTAGTKTGTFGLSYANGTSVQYLYAASSSSNNLKVQANLNDNASWTISIRSSVAEIKAQGTYTRNWLRYNPSSSLFSCYSSGQDDVAIYKKPGSEVTVPVYSSLSDLTAAGEPTSEGSPVTVILSDEEIKSIAVTSSGYRNGIFLQVGDQEIEVYSHDVPESWVVGGKVSGTLTNCIWKKYGTTWELCPKDWSELTYTAPVEDVVTPVELIMSDISCTNKTQNSLTFTWAEVDHAIGYMIFFDGRSVGTITETLYTANSLVANTTHTIAVKAVGEGNYTTSTTAKTCTATTEAAQPVDPVDPEGSIDFIFNTEEGRNALGMPAVTTSQSGGVALTDPDAGIKVYTLTNSDVTVSIDHNTSQNTNKLWKNTNSTVEVRLYTGTILTVSVPNELSITGIQFSGNDIAGLSLNGDGTQYSNGVWDGTATSVTFNVTKTVKLNQISVTVE